MRDGDLREAEMMRRGPGGPGCKFSLCPVACFRSKRYDAARTLERRYCFVVLSEVDAYDNRSQLNLPHDDSSDDSIDESARSDVSRRQRYLYRGSTTH